MNDKTRRINTGMYGQRAFDILDSLHGQMSDGYWENKNYNKYWLNFDVRRDADDRVYFEVSSSPDRFWGGRTMKNPFAGMDAAGFKSWLAGRLRKMIGVEAEYKKWPDGWWSRTSTGLESQYLSDNLDVRVSDIYRVYDELKGKTRAYRDERIIGNRAPAETVRAKKELARAKKEAKAVYDARRATLDRQFQAAQEKYEADKKALWEDYYNKAKALDPDDVLI